MNNPQESVDHSKSNDYRTIEQTMEKLSGGTRRLAAQLTTSASFDSLWDVLTDYDRLNLYIPNLLSSKKIFQKGNNVHLKQVGAQDFLGMKFSAEVTIDLFEDKELGLLKFNLMRIDNFLQKARSCLRSQAFFTVEELEYRHHQKSMKIRFKKMNR